MDNISKKGILQVMVVMKDTLKSTPRRNISAYPKRKIVTIMKNNVALNLFR
jgi:hypothetical protein